MKVIRWNKREKPNLESLKKDLEKEGLDCYLFASNPGDFYPEHAHEHDEIRIVLSGSMKLGVNEKEVILNKGDRLELPKNTVHWAKPLGSKKCVMLSANRH